MRILLSLKENLKRLRKAVESHFLLFLKGNLPGLMIPAYFPVVLGVPQPNNSVIDRSIQAKRIPKQTFYQYILDRWIFNYMINVNHKVECT